MTTTLLSPPHCSMSRTTSRSMLTPRPGPAYERLGVRSHPDARIDVEFARIVDELTRRGFLAGGLSGAAVLGLAACGSGTPGDGGSSATTRTIETPVGTSLTVPSTPKRVIALGASISNLCELGVPVVGTWTNAENSVPARYHDQVAKLPKVQAADGTIDVEVMAALRPDLIFVWSGIPTLSKVQQIAPTFVYDSSSTITWQQRAQQTAYAVNRVNAFATAQQKYQAEVQRIRTTYASQLTGHTWYVVTPWDAANFQLEAVTTPGPAALKALGARFGTQQKKADAADNGGAELSMELISDLSDADAIVLDDNGYGSTDGTLVSANGRHLVGQPTWKKLPAVAAGHLVTFNAFNIDSFTSGTAYLDAIETLCKKLQA
ncbi:putative Periplasmic binding protein [Nostocoides japonicum T1-X7]|uniref:Putative Periplasmic binding protein n=1 Tax=Nostocoides japonicum T1-X7 TaxID=1194083 RepID=A0A077LTX8_9MICO|nr:ABC transporter substrate-binding protein [Tetrasphaera japonica]CCH76856.1 putative Periplasmic binding protein [Tetrasphaera japonica T1-X7]